jgi:hypothetical protein
VTPEGGGAAASRNVNSSRMSTKQHDDDRQALADAAMGTDGLLLLSCDLNVKDMYTYIGSGDASI